MKTKKPIKIPANEKAFAFREKLQALCQRGVDGEKAGSQRKLKRLESRVDFSVNVTANLFSGRFSAASDASPVCIFPAAQWDIAAAVKWALEGATRIPCLYRTPVTTGAPVSSELCAKATTATVRRLTEIAGIITGAFATLWDQYHKAGGLKNDRRLFLRGLYDGMMNEPRPEGERLPARSQSAGRGRKAKPEETRTLNIHPYEVALELGREIRFNASLGDLTAQLDRAIKGELEAPHE